MGRMTFLFFIFGTPGRCEGHLIYSSVSFLNHLLLLEKILDYSFQLVYTHVQKEGYQWDGPRNLTGSKYCAKP
jgi:hypothetical protein